MTDNELVLTLSNMMDQRMQALSESIDQRMQALSNCMDQKLLNLSNSMDQKLLNLSDSMDQKLQNLSDSMDQKFEVVNNRLDNLERHLELETDKNISLIAEGHLNLERKLDEALAITKQVSDEHETTKLRLNILEKDVYDIKKRLAQFA